MIQTIYQKKSVFYIPTDTKRNFIALFAIFIFIIGLTVFQDFLESNRNDNSFYFSESLLFKTIWILFIPFLLLLSSILKNQKLDSLVKSAFFIITPIIIHLVILPFVFLFFSILFYNGRYDMYKILSYTLANDLYKLVLIYSAFVLGYRYLSYKLADRSSPIEKSYLKTLIINNGKNNIVIEVNNIYQITADTPYIMIQLEDKKYLHNATLKSIYGQLNQRRFVRIHKSTIVNLYEVASFKSRLNGDYDISLKNGTELRLSRTYASNFKSKFKNAHQVTT